MDPAGASFYRTTSRSAAHAAVSKAPAGSTDLIDLMDFTDFIDYIYLGTFFQERVIKNNR